jgi:hypothetical protein
MVLKTSKFCEYKHPPLACNIWTYNGGYVRITDYKYPKIIHILNRCLKNYKRMSLEPIKYSRKNRVYGEICKEKYSKKIDNFLRDKTKNLVKYKLNKVKLNFNF